MSITRYTQRQILNRLALADREEQLARQAAARDGANQANSINLINKLVSGVGEGAKIQAQQDALRLNEGAKVLGAGEAAPLVAPATVEKDPFAGLKKAKPASQSEIDEMNADFLAADGSAPAKPLVGLENAKEMSPEEMRKMNEDFVNAPDSADATIAVDDTEVARGKAPTGFAGFKEEVAAAGAVPARASNVDADGNFVPPRYARTPEEEARFQIERMRKSGEPNFLTNLATAGQAKNQMDLASSLAERQAVKAITDARAKAEKEGFDRWADEQRIKVAQSRGGKSPELVAAETALTEAKTKKLNSEAGKLQLSNKNIPQKTREQLDDGIDTDFMLQDIRDLAYDIVRKGGSLPIGKNRVSKKSLIEAIAAETGMTSGQAADALQAGVVGIGAGGSNARGSGSAGPFIDAETLQKAIDRVDLASLPEDEQQFWILTKQAIQLAGKAREGGRMTDADYEKYVETLFNNSSPAGFVRSLEDLINRNARTYNRVADYAKRNYGDDLEGIYPTLELRPQASFDWSTVNESQISGDANEIFEGGKKRRGLRGNIPATPIATGVGAATGGNKPSNSPRSAPD